MKPTASTGPAPALLMPLMVHLQAVPRGGGGAYTIPAVFRPLPLCRSSNSSSWFCTAASAGLKNGRAHSVVNQPLLTLGPPSPPSPLLLPPRPCWAPGSGWVHSLIIGTRREPNDRHDELRGEPGPGELASRGNVGTEDVVGCGPVDVEQCDRGSCGGHRRDGCQQGLCRELGRWRGRRWRGRRWRGRRRRWRGRWGGREGGRHFASTTCGGGGAVESCGGSGGGGGGGGGQAAAQAVLSGEAVAASAPHLLAGQVAYPHRRPLRRRGLAGHPCRCPHPRLHPRTRRCMVLGVLGALGARARGRAAPAGLLGAAGAVGVAVGVARAMGWPQAAAGSRKSPTARCRCQRRCWQRSSTSSKSRGRGRLW